MLKWKSINPDIKILISIGGWTAGSTEFTPMVSTDSTRTTFCQSVLTTLKTWKLDGLGISQTSLIKI